VDNGAKGEVIWGRCMYSLEQLVHQIRWFWLILYQERARRILNTSNPRERRALGRITVNFDSKIWDASKSAVSILTP
jgi:predicted NAD-dependent protein-ADP-ribosyltransferase YbiA (DUF1768 family)